MENTSLVITEEQDNNKQVGVNNDITNVLYSFSKQQLLDWDHNSLLSSDEEIILTNLAKAGENAREIIKISGETNGKELYFLKNKIEIAKLAVSILIISNQGLVYNTAKELTGIKKPTKDVIQEGNMGIMKAAEKFDHLKGNKFSTYASWWIKQRILLHIKTNKVITLPIKIAGKISTLKRMLGDNNLKLEEITEKDITLLIKIGIFNRKEILKLITAAKNENLLSIDWENDEGESFIYNTISDGKNNPEKIFFQKKTDEMIRDNIRNLFLDKENATYNKRGVIISLRNNIHGLNDNIVEILVKLTKSRDINTIERTSSRIVDLYLKYRDTILITLRSMIENEEKLSQDLIDTIDKICKKIIYLGNNMDFIIKDFIEKDETTALLFCLIEDYNQKNKNNKKIIIEETIKSIFIDNKHNIIKYFDFIRELLFLYSHKITNIEITDDELEILYRSFIKNIGTDPTLQDLGILFSVTRERIRQMEEKGLERFKKYFLNKNLFSKN